MPHGPSLEQLERNARAAGYEDYRSMLYELYVVQSRGTKELIKLLEIGEARLKRHFKQFGIQLKGKGGPNSVKVVMTKELIREIALFGVPAVSKRLGVSPAALYRGIKETKL